MSPNQDKMSFWEIGFSQMLVTALSAFKCMKFNVIGYKVDQIMWLNDSLWSYFIISCYTK